MRRRMWDRWFTMQAAVKGQGFCGEPDPNYTFICLYDAGHCGPCTFGLTRSNPSRIEKSL